MDPNEWGRYLRMKEKLQAKVDGLEQQLSTSQSRERSLEADRQQVYDNLCEIAEQLGCEGPRDYGVSLLLPLIMGSVKGLQARLQLGQEREAKMREALEAVLRETFDGHVAKLAKAALAVPAESELTAKKGESHAISVFDAIQVAARDCQSSGETTKAIRYDSAEGKRLDTAETSTIHAATGLSDVPEAAVSEPQLIDLSYVDKASPEKTAWLLTVVPAAICVGLLWWTPADSYLGLVAAACAGASSVSIFVLLERTLSR